MQNARVGLAIQLQRVAREAGHQQATFRAEDRVGWDFIAFKESPTAAPMAYPFIHHFPGGQPPAQGSPYISVDTATVTELLKSLRPLTSFPKHVVKLHTTVLPPPTATPGQTPNIERPAHAPPPAPTAPQTNFQRPPPVLRDLPSTSRGIFSPCPHPAAIPLAKPLPPSKANTRGKLPPTPFPTHTPLPHGAPLRAPPTPTPTTSPPHLTPLPN